MAKPRGKSAKDGVPDLEKAEPEFVIIPAPPNAMTINGRGIGEGAERTIDQTPVAITHVAFCYTQKAFVRFAVEQMRGTDGLSFVWMAYADRTALFWAKANPFTLDKVMFCMDVTDKDYRDFGPIKEQILNEVAE